MAVTWKEVALADNVPNLGNADLTLNEPNAIVSRKVNFNQYDGGGTNDLHSRSLDFRWKSRDGSYASMLKLSTGNFFEDGSDAINTTLDVTATTQNFTASGNIAFNATGSLSFQGAASTLIYASELTILDYGVDAAEGPVLNLKRNPVGQFVGGDGDILGVIKFTGENDANGLEEYASINTKILDASAASEDGEMDIQLMTAGYSLSALKLLPRVANNVTGKLQSLEVYATTLKDLLIGFQKYSLSRYFKMYITPESTNGFEHLHSYPFKHALDQKQAGGNQQNDAYEIGAAAYSNFADGSVPLDGAYGDSFLSTGLSDDVGYGDSWVPYNHPSDAPAVTVKISGHIWWKPKYDPPTGQSISTWLGHEVVSDGHKTDISEDSGLKFDFVDETETYVLSDGEEVTKVPFSFTYNIVAAPGVASNHLFLLGMRVKDGQASGYLGQQAGAIQSGNYAGMAVDIAMLVYPQ